MQRHHITSPVASTSAGYCIAAALSATAIGCARIVATQSFSEEAHYSLSRFPVSGPPNRDFPNPPPAIEPTVEPSPAASQPPLIGYALLDSGATHPMRQASSEEEWETAEEVQVSLAGDQSTIMRLKRGGTLLLPPGRDGLVQPIVPMGAIIEQLGYKLVWSAGSCKLYPPDGKSLRLASGQKCLPGIG